MLLFKPPTVKAGRHVPDEATTVIRLTPRHNVTGWARWPSPGPWGIIGAVMTDTPGPGGRA